MASRQANDAVASERSIFSKNQDYNNESTEVQTPGVIRIQLYIVSIF